jgi:hypothetical protein
LLMPLWNHLESYLLNQFYAKVSKKEYATRLIPKTNSNSTIVPIDSP